ncbi:MAG: hypoxanthine phosphoribosyltransferase [Armatimonadota bacterium]|nr:hypoxanthine phosphoribosyltransferase [Armatimonadota bacterium]MDR7428414.1 hypoxanthine phosphoribosyltransferase [Armatimonadota bacterium]MDR7465017.1 hypoxanthine phosphoribosyltransferase [Armatimonadota bacterium]MDR7475953.1 hypoxanthine phosphoribosyltransferase [Armatimonadota bacterium]MDR7540230.1 hypoxanthine phosphoribosyltransferase [Armatimonadota bacterium]
MASLPALRPDATLGEVLLTEEQIRARVAELADHISEDYAGKDLVLVTVLKGGVFFLADLSRALKIPAAIDFMAISSYTAESPSGVARLLKDLDEEITGRHVLLVEDIIDTGLTAAYLLRVLQTRNPASLAICTLLDKTARRIVPTLPIRYRGFEIPDVFVVGYGLDYRQRYRHLPYIAVLKDGPEASLPPLR